MLQDQSRAVAERQPRARTLAHRLREGGFSDQHVSEAGDRLWRSTGGRSSFNRHAEALGGRRSLGKGKPVSRRHRFQCGGQPLSRFGLEADSPSSSSGISEARDHFAIGQHRTRMA
jgi:hypothetical protein